MLISTKADTPGKKAVIERARQLSDFKWTPVKDVVTYSKASGKMFFAAGETVSGMPYSSAENNDKFIAENVLFETFLSMVENPDSALYNKDLGGAHNGKVWTYFGIVCNGFVRYSLNIRRRISTKCWLDVPGMKKIADEGCYKAEDIELCDVLFAYGKGRNHVALITDILRDEKGVIKKIEVSEAVSPSCIRESYDVETYFEKFKLFALCRYDYLEQVSECSLEDKKTLDRGAEKDLPYIAVDMGNKSNYELGEEVIISAFGEGENKIEISRGGEVIETIDSVGYTKTGRSFDVGYYKIKNLTYNAEVEFCVVKPDISYSAEDGKLTVNAKSEDKESEILYMDFRVDGPISGSLVKVEELTEKEKKSGAFTRKIPEEAATFKVYFKNKYGVWTHRMIKF